MKKSTSAIIVGTGSHSKAVISLLKRNKSFNIKGLLDTSKNFDINEKIMNYPVIGSINNFDKILSIDKFVFFVAIGDNSKRREIFNYLNKKDVQLPNLFDINSYVDISAELGKGNLFFYNTFVGPLVKLGSNNIINTGSIIEHDSQISSHCHLSPKSLICGNCFIEDLCFIGANSTIIDNIKLSSSTIIGAGSTVIKNILEPSLTYVGSPAKNIRNS